MRIGKVIIEGKDCHSEVLDLSSLGGECFRDNEYARFVRLIEGENNFRVVNYLGAKTVISETVTIVKS